MRSDGNKQIRFIALSVYNIRGYVQVRFIFFECLQCKRLRAAEQLRDSTMMMESPG